MENSKDKAKDLINKFPQYDWDENKGYIQNMKETVRICNKVIDEITEVVNDNCLEYDDNFWSEVRKELSIYE